MCVLLFRQGLCIIFDSYPTCIIRMNVQKYEKLHVCLYTVVAVHLTIDNIVIKRDWKLRGRDYKMHVISYSGEVNVFVRVCP